MCSAAIHRLVAVELVSEQARSSEQSRSRAEKKSACDFPSATERVCSCEPDKATGQCAGQRAGFRHVGDIIPQAVPDRKQEQPNEKNKSGDPRLEDERQDVAVDLA